MKIQFSQSQTKFFLVLLLLISFLSINLPFATADIGILTNTPGYLNISTYDGGNQPIHPSVIYTETPWNGYRYIMAFTPLTNGNDDFENPSLRGSNDGINWYKFQGCPDPVIPAPPDVATGGFNSDPNIVMVGNTLYLFYRYSDNVPSTIDITYYVSTVDAVTWTAPIRTDLPRGRSPSFFNNATGWQCWAHNVSTSAIEHFVSTNTINWTQQGTVTMPFNGWHHEVKYFDNAYQMLIISDAIDGNMSLYYFTSTDGLTWTYGGPKPILAPSAAGWDNYEIYKSSFIKQGDIYKIWYSGVSLGTQSRVSYIEYNDLSSWYGLIWNKNTDAYTRIGSASTQTDYNNLYPWNQIARVNLADNGSVMATYGESGFKYDGSNGQVMVKVPKFYYRVENTSATVAWYISSVNATGFKVHPSFIRNGIEYDYFYIGAFEATTYNVSTVQYNTNDGAGINFTADKLSSIAGAKPISGLNNTLTIVNARIAANNRGAGWQLQSYGQLSAMQMLYLVEYGSFNSQTVLSAGVTGITDDGSHNMAVNTGYTAGVGAGANDLGNQNGQVSITHYQTAQTTTPLSYRGVENIYGNIYEYVDGINIRNNGVWLADNTFSSNTFAAPYYDTGLTLKPADGWIGTIKYSTTTDYAFLPNSSTGGSATAKLCDYHYPGTGDNIVLSGGKWNDGTNAGMYALLTAKTSTDVSRVQGARLSYMSQAAEKPTSAFTASPTNTSEPNGVQFKDQSSNAASWQWNFGDGTINNTTQNPYHAYAAPGVYTVTLTTTNTEGASTLSKVNYVTINAGSPQVIIAPEAAFQASSFSGINPLTVVFTDLSTGTVDSYFWDFGDGTTSIEQNPTHTFHPAGNYTVTLTVSNDGGSSTAITMISVTIAPVVPSGSPFDISTNLIIFGTLGVLVFSILLVILGSYAYVEITRISSQTQRRGYNPTNDVGNVITVVIVGIVMLIVGFGIAGIFYTVFFGG